MGRCPGHADVPGGEFLSIRVSIDDRPATPVFTPPHRLRRPTPWPPSCEEGGTVTGRWTGHANVPGGEFLSIRVSIDDRPAKPVFTPPHRLRRPTPYPPSCEEGGTAMGRCPGHADVPGGEFLSIRVSIDDRPATPVFTPPHRLRRPTPYPPSCEEGGTVMGRWTGHASVPAGEFLSIRVSIDDRHATPVFSPPLLPADLPPSPLPVRKGERRWVDGPGMQVCRLANSCLSEYL